MKRLIQILYNNNGLTLLELILALTILGIIISPIGYLYYDAQKQYTAGTRTINSQTEINTTVNAIKEDIRRVQSKNIKVDIASIMETKASIQGLDVDSDGDIDASNKIIIRYYDDIDNNSVDELVQVVYAYINNEIYKYSLGQTYNELADISDVDIASGQIICNYVTNFNIEEEAGYFDFTITVDPDDVGDQEVDPISLDFKFVPRYIR